MIKLQNYDNVHIETIELKFIMMNIYTAYHLIKHGQVQDFRIIKQGFNFFAFLFGTVWFLNYRMLKLSIISIFILTLLYLALYFEFLNNVQISLLVLTVQLYIGSIANDQLEKRLETQNYDFVDIIVSKSKDEALLEMIDKRNVI